MIIPLNIHHAFNPNASTLDNAYCLEALLNCMVDINTGYLKTHDVPDLYNSGVVYGRTHIWEPISALYLPNKRPIDPIFFSPHGESGGLQRGDCKSLATAYIAQSRLAGKQCRPVFRWAPRDDNSGAVDFHILVMFPDGSWEDPSRVLGMGAQEVARFYR